MQNIDVVFMCMQNFLQRVKNLAFYCGSLLGEQLRALPLYTRLGRVHGVDCLATPVVHGSAMFLYNMDFSMEWPRPLPPTVQLVGALLPAPAKPVAPAFQVGASYGSFSTFASLQVAPAFQVQTAPMLVEPVGISCGIGMFHGQGRQALQESSACLYRRTTI
jgi:hypothetical protein